MLGNCMTVACVCQTRDFIRFGQMDIVDIDLDRKADCHFRHLEGAPRHNEDEWLLLIETVTYTVYL